jgi:hypothetical protein
MKRRLALWAMIGLFVGCVGVAYAFATAPDVEIQRSAISWALQVFACATCPIIAAGPRFYWVPLANAASYALLGLLWNWFGKNQAKHCPAFAFPVFIFP